MTNTVLWGVTQWGRSREVKVVTAYTALRWLETGSRILYFGPSLYDFKETQTL